MLLNVCGLQLLPTVQWSWKGAALAAASMPFACRTLFAFKRSACIHTVDALGEGRQRTLLRCGYRAVL